MTLFAGTTISELGAMPIEHFNIAPLHTWLAIDGTSSADCCE